MSQSSLLSNDDYPCVRNLFFNLFLLAQGDEVPVLQCSVRVPEGTNDSKKAHTGRLSFTRRTMRKNESRTRV